MKPHAQGLAWFEQQDHEEERELQAEKDFWLGIVDTKQCSCQSPREAKHRPCNNHQVTFVAATDNYKPERVVAVLRRYTGNDTKVRPPVLFVHGATAWRGTFFEPNGGIVRHLKDDFDVWTLDWRASKLITHPWQQHSTGKDVPCALRNGTLDDVIEGELPEAVRKIAAVRGEGPSIVGHCIGAAVTAAAIARGKIGIASPAPIGKCVVLSAIGLFYRGSVDTWLRAQERLDLDTVKDWRLRFDDATDWPPEYETVFKMWERTPYPHCEIAFCRRLSALFGAPYRPNDIGSIHGTSTKLEEQFGAIPVTILNQCARNVRRGWSGRADAGEVNTDDIASRRAAHFQKLKLTLLTGGENQLWHRDSIDRMYEWLQRYNPRTPVNKRVFENYGHQDLWWSPSAAARGSVYDYVRAALSES